MCLFEFIRKCQIFIKTVAPFHTPTNSIWNSCIFFILISSECWQCFFILTTRVVSHVVLVWISQITSISEHLGLFAPYTSSFLKCLLKSLALFYTRLVLGMVYLFWIQITLSYIDIRNIFCQFTFWWNIIYNFFYYLLFLFLKNICIAQGQEDIIHSFS